jgi:hypothetical protein
MNATRTREGFIMNATRFLVAMTVLVVAAGCQSAAEAPCLIQRPPLGGYTMKFTLQGAAPAGCDTILPAILGDNWRMDGYADRAVYMKSDFMLYPEDGGDPNHPVLGQGTLSAEPVDGICTIPDVTEMRSDTDPFGIGQLTLAYHAHDMRFLSGARYQGSTFEAVVDVTIGACTAPYDVQGLTPSQQGGTCVTDVDCDPFADPLNGRPLGSGINSDYAISCIKEQWAIDYLTGDPNVGICFFTKPFPGLK